MISLEFLFTSTITMFVHNIIFPLMTTFYYHVPTSNLQGPQIRITYNRFPSDPHAHLDYIPPTFCVWKLWIPCKIDDWTKILLNHPFCKLLIGK